MMFRALLFSVALALGAQAAALPALTTSYCADVVETITIDGSAPAPGRAYTLCVDNNKIRWNQKSSDGSHISIFNGTDFWALVKDSSKPGGWNCSVRPSCSRPLRCLRAAVCCACPHCPASTGRSPCPSST